MLQPRVLQLSAMPAASVGQLAIVMAASVLPSYFGSREWAARSAELRRLREETKPRVDASCRPARGNLLIVAGDGNSTYELLLVAVNL